MLFQDIIVLILSSKCSLKEGELFSSGLDFY